MHSNIKALKKALEETNVPFSDIPGFPDALVAEGHPFVRCSTPFNAESIAALCRDKAAVHTILEGRARMPKTAAFLDPYGAHPDLAERSLEDILKKSLPFLYPRIVKMNQGERGRNVYIARDEAEARNALAKIFDKGSRDYDYIALVLV
jgi:hypothetical protein